MGFIRSATDLVAVTFFLSGALIANCAAQAQTTGAPRDGKRIQVLQIVEARSAKASSVKKFRFAAAAVKKKLTTPDPIGRAGPTAADVAPKQKTTSEPMAESALAVDKSVVVEQNSVARSLLEQIDTLTVDDRAIAFASFSREDDNISPAVSETVAATANRDVDDAVVDNATNMADRDAPQSPVRSPLISPVMATLSGALLACGFGWYLVSSSGRRESRLGSSHLN
jgi:hypothetical protein